MTIVNMFDAKSQLSRFVESVESGAEEEIIIARAGRPAARLVPLAPKPVGRRIGVAKGKFAVPDDIDAAEGAIAAMFAAPME
jgi:prevent-host-death family protein